MGQDMTDQTARTPLQVTSTERGFAIVEWRDRYDVPCTLQKSSLATEDCIWFGTITDRMHLTQEMVRNLLPLLQRFAETGELSA
jgi:hypothetical protein